MPQDVRAGGEQVADLRRIRNLLRDRRGRRPRWLLAWHSGGVLTAGDLRGFERGELAPTAEQLEVLATIYGFDVADLHPQRTELRVDAQRGVLWTSGIEVPFGTDDDTELLVAYLRLVRRLRDEPTAPVIELRRGDVEALATALGTDGPTVLERLAALMGSTANQRRAAVTMFVTGATIVVLAGGAVALDTSELAPDDHAPGAEERVVVATDAEPGPDLVGTGSIDAPGSEPAVLEDPGTGDVPLMDPAPQEPSPAAPSDPVPSAEPSVPAPDDTPSALDAAPTDVADGGPSVEQPDDDVAVTVPGAPDDEVAIGDTPSALEAPVAPFEEPELVELPDDGGSPSPGVPVPDIDLVPVPDAELVPAPEEAGGAPGPALGGAVDDDDLLDDPADPVDDATGPPAEADAPEPLDWIVLGGGSGFTFHDDGSITVGGSGERRAMVAGPPVDRAVITVTDASHTIGNGWGVVVHGSYDAGTGTYDGYTVQFDHGFDRRIIVRERIGGDERAPFVRSAERHELRGAVIDARIVVDGAALRVELDGEPVIDVADLRDATGRADAPVEGAIGLRLWSSTELTIDSFEVEALPDPEPDADPDPEPDTDPDPEPEADPDPEPDTDPDPEPEADPDPGHAG